MKYFWENILCSFEAEDMQFGQYSKNYNCIPLPIILESKTKKELVDKIKSLKNKLYLITCETLGNPTIAKMLKKCMLKSVDFHNLLITMNPCCIMQTEPRIPGPSCCRPYKCTCFQSEEESEEEEPVPKIDPVSWVKS